MAALLLGRCCFYVIIIIIMFTKKELIILMLHEVAEALYIVSEKMAADALSPVCW